MEIVDLRPAGERCLSALWARPPDASALALSRLAGPLADRLADRRALGRGPAPADTFLVSVGNLRVGGTGKTPVTARLMADLAAAGLSGVVLTRGHGGATAGPRLVTPDDAEAGDEARMLAARSRGTAWQVIQARRRAAGLVQALALSPRPDIVVVEDGHQTAAVPRHLDVLILDRWEVTPEGVVPGAGLVLPWGPYRETPRGAGRAGVWLLETPCPASAAAWPGVEVAGFAREVTLAAVAPPADVVGLVSGLARPEGFEAACARALGAPPRLSVRCADHCRYDGRLLSRVLAAGQARGVAAWITTEKDLVKLAPLWPAATPLTVARLEVHWTSAPALPEIVLERRRRWRADRQAKSG